MDCPLARIPLDIRQMIFKLLFDNRTIHTWSEKVRSELEITNPEVALGVREPVTDERGPLSYAVCDTDLLSPESYWVYRQRALVYSNSDAERTCTVRDNKYTRARKGESLQPEEIKNEEADDSTFVDLALLTAMKEETSCTRPIHSQINDHISFANFFDIELGYGVQDRRDFSKDSTTTENEMVYLDYVPNSKSGVQSVTTRRSAIKKMQLFAIISDS
ncbi:hypothetical protein OEA41_007758 [Lepraria neglecta]|uniref:Uncharacterized protein n=1 Tax=Lepraria neglecta TaxID=209136 RepID=A0AAD9ZE52_9LECA|nr:hypothetical protein OEA41_007758 [Lepraria neglecta]